MDTKKLLVLAAIMILFHFYYTYFRISLEARKRLQPWLEALKRIE